MEYKDYYAALGVKREATADEIKVAYRKLAREHHPDLSHQTGAEERFKEISEAHEVLKDPEKRAAYDALGQASPGQDFRPPPGWDEGFEFSFTKPSRSSARGRDEGYSDFFENIFGQMQGARGGASAASGRDHHAKLAVSLPDAVNGTTRMVSLRSPEVTPEGRVGLRERAIEVAIPKGTRAGEVIKLAGQGGQGGDLYLEIEITPHPLWRVEGADIFCDVPVAPWEAALGRKVAVDMPQGRVEIGIPPGSSSGRKLRLRGRGLGGGDFYAVLKIVMPPSAGPEAQRLWRELEQTVKFDARREM